MLNNLLTYYTDSYRGLSKEIWLLALMTLINRAGAMVIPFMTIYLTSDLGFSMTQSGYVMACFGLGSVVGSYLGGQLTDRIGYHPTMFWSLFLSGGMFIILMWMKTFFAVSITIFCLSLIADTFRPALFSSVAIFSHAETRTRSISLIRLAINLGFSAGPTIGGLLVATSGFDSLFIIDGLTCMGAALIIQAKIPIGQKEKVTKEEAKQALNNVSILKDKIYLIFIGFNLLVGIVFMQFFFTIPVYFKDFLLLDESQIGFLMGLNGLILAFVEMPFVFFLEKKRPPLYYISIGAFLIGLSYFVFVPFSSWLGIVVISVLFFTFGEMYKIPFANAFALNRSNAENRGTYMSFYVMTFSLSNVIAPIFGFQIAEKYGYDMLWSILGVFCLISTIGYLYLQKILERETAPNTAEVVDLEY